MPFGQARHRGALGKAQNGSESVDEVFAVLSDPGFEFTSQPHRIAYFAAFLNRIGALKSKVGDWKELFWKTAYHQQGPLIETA